MRYYFPGPLDTLKLPHSVGILKYSVNSGENAIHLVLKSFNLPGDTKVAVPMFVCDSLKNVVIKAGLHPIYLDLKKDSYWTDYDTKYISGQDCKVIILIHLYGFIHPDTCHISEYCKQNKIYLIHDMAQCYGANESLLDYGSIVYSCSPGKSTTAAGGGLIKNIDGHFYTTHIKKPSALSNKRATLLMKSRIYGYKLSASDKLLQKVLKKIPAGDTITSMAPVQRDAAEYVISRLKEIKPKRAQRHRILADAIKQHNLLSIAYDDTKGLYFKCVVCTKRDPAGFKKYLEANNIPYFSLFDSITVGVEASRGMQNFNNNAPRFIEISTEASIPLNEIERIAAILKKYN